MALTFLGGIHPTDCKSVSEKKSIEVMPPPSTLIFPVCMHIGTPCQPLVKAGDYVKMGQIIADSPSNVSAPIHSSVSGTVLSIEPWVHPAGGKQTAIFIENDQQDIKDDRIRPRDGYDDMKPEEIISAVRSAGIVGMGGAAFPTHAKISSGLGRVGTIIINAAECEPYITSDHRLMLEQPERIIDGINILIKVFGLTHATLAIESNKYDSVVVFRKLLKNNKRIVLRVVHTKYPQGSEKQLIQTLTGRQVPPGGLPSAVGCVVFNVATVAAIADAVLQGLPLISRVVTVSGSAVGNSKNLLVRIGTPVEELFNLVGGFSELPQKILFGGPMMGVAQHSLKVPIVKATGSVLALSKNDDRTLEDPVCIHCGKCVSACPMHLMPLYFHLYAQKNMFDECGDINVRDCIECGSCEYKCPARIPLIHTIRLAKQRLAGKKKQGAQS